MDTRCYRGSAERLTSLDGAWTLRYGRQDGREPRTPAALAASGWPAVPARVPGNVEIDLMAAGELPDLEIGDNVFASLRFEDHDWWYSRRFTAPAFAPGERVELEFEGLDCFGTVWIDSREVGSSANMLVPARFDVTDAVRPGAEHELTVRIASATLAGWRREAKAGEWAPPANWEALAVRKAPHMYGWDILPRLVSAGLWRSVRLCVLPPVRWRSVAFATRAIDVAKSTARVELSWDFACAGRDPRSLRWRAVLAQGGRELLRREARVLSTHSLQRLELADVAPWWPRGYGEAALCDLTLELIDEQGRVLDAWREQVGVRVVELRRSEITTDDEPGEFCFVVNGERIFVRGTNWVALDALHARDRARLDAATAMLAELDCNMVRMWGGTVYEHDDFYAFCDREGILVWQDFALACAIYPRDDGFAAAVREEAEAIVTRLRNRPSLALWSGDNECDYFMAHRGIDPNRHRLTREVLPEVLQALDPHRPYLASSPYVSSEAMRRGDYNNLTPEQHLWGPRDDFKGPFYTKATAHFVSEIGYHGCPDRRSLERWFTPGHVWPKDWQHDPQWLCKAVQAQPDQHDCDYRLPLMARQAGFLFGGAVPSELDDFIIASQISQAEALKAFIEWARTGKWRRTGMLWWNLRDGWPVISDAVVDFDGRRKLAYAYIQRSQQRLCAIVGEPVDGRHPLVVVNDTRQAASGRLVVRDLDGQGALVDTAVAVAANGIATVGSIAAPTEPRMWALEWTTEICEGRNHYLAGPRPFDLARYRGWLDRLMIPAECGPQRGRAASAAKR